MYTDLLTPRTRMAKEPAQTGSGNGSGGEGAKSGGITTAYGGCFPAPNIRNWILISCIGRP